MEIINKFITETRQMHTSNVVLICGWMQGVEYDFECKSTWEKVDDRIHNRYTGYISGAKSFEYTYRNGLMHGTYTKYYTVCDVGIDNTSVDCRRKIKEIVEYQDGRRHGDQIKYNKQDNVCGYKYYIAGKIHGYSFNTYHGKRYEQCYWKGVEVSKDRLAQLEAADKH